MSLAGIESQAVAMAAGGHPLPSAYLSLSPIQPIVATCLSPRHRGLPVGRCTDTLSRAQAAMLELRQYNKMTDK